MPRESADEGDQAQTEATKIVLNHSENILSLSDTGLATNRLVYSVEKHPSHLVP